MLMLRGKSVLTNYWVSALGFCYLIILLFTSTHQISAANLLPPGPNDTICKGDTTQLSATNPLALSYTWTPNYNISSTSIPNPFVWPLNTTTYNVTINGITNNLIANPSFSLGNTGFTSSYTYTTNLWPEGTYYIGANPTTYHSSFASCGDHTTGTGLMMIVNGSGHLTLQFGNRLFR